MVSGPLVARRGSRGCRGGRRRGYAGAALPPRDRAVRWTVLALALFALGATSGALDVAMNNQGHRRRGPRPAPDLRLPARGLLLRRARGRRLGGPRRPRRHLADRAPARQSAPSSRRRWRSRSVTSPRTRPPPFLAPLPACSLGAAPARSQRPRRADAALRRRRPFFFCGGCSGSGWSRSVCCWPRARSTTGARCTSRASTARRPGPPPAGLAVFSLTMGFARLAGDRLATAFGSRAVVRGGLLAGACALAATAARTERAHRDRGVRRARARARPRSIRSRCARPRRSRTSRRASRSAR